MQLLSTARNAFYACLETIQDLSLGFLLIFVSLHCSFYCLTSSPPWHPLPQNQCLYTLVIHAHIGLAITLGCMKVDLSSPTSVAFTVSILFNLIAVGILMLQQNRHRHQTPADMVEEMRENLNSTVKNVALLFTIVALAAASFGAIFMVKTTSA